jgi:hypothetical protein
MHLHLRRINNLGSFSTAALPCDGFIPHQARLPFGHRMTLTDPPLA